MWKNVTDKEKGQFDDLVHHPLQSYEWGEFREKTGVTVIRRGLFVSNTLREAYQLTIHKIPHTSFTIGYLPKCDMPSLSMVDDVKSIGEKYHCIFVQFEPNIFSNEQTIEEIKNLSLISSAHPLFTKYSFQLDITKSEDELLKSMSQKTRYNIRVAQKHGVTVSEETSQKAFDAYLALTEETTKRQGFYAHTKKYHQLMWETLKNKSANLEKLTAHLFIAYLGQQPLTTWIVFTFHDMLYYPYGASSSLHRETMSSNLMMWEVIKFGKKLKLKTFDMWGALGPNPDTKDPWYGFHRFKMGYGPTLVEFAGSYDLVINPLLYQGYKIADKLRWLLLRLRK